MKKAVSIFLTIWLVLFYMVLLAYSDTTPNIWIVKVKYQETYDSQDIQFFELRRGAEAFLLSAPGQSDIALYFRQHNNQQVVLTLEGK